MSRRQKIDSMGLMIDTMCNGVGGLVLVAILVVLISLGNSPSSQEGQMRKQQLENEIAAMQIQSEMLGEDIERLSEVVVESDAVVTEHSIDDLSGQHQQIKELLKQVNELRFQLDHLEQQRQDATVADPGEYVESELKELNRLRQEMKSYEKRLAVAQEQWTDSNDDYQEMLAEVSDEQKSRVQRLSVPREKSYSRYDFIVFRYGKCYVLNAEDLYSPPSHFNVLDQSRSHIIFEPRAAMGNRISDASIKAFISKVRRNNGTCMLEFYPDSFGLYQRAKALTDSQGVSIGIDFYTSDSPIAFTTSGGEEILGLGQ